MHIEIRGAEKLSFRERQVVTYKEIGKSTDDIARLLGLSPATVATLYNRAKTKGFELVIIIPGVEWGVTALREDNEDME